MYLWFETMGVLGNVDFPEEFIVNSKLSFIRQTNNVNVKPVNVNFKNEGDADNSTNQAARYSRS
jgi:hypothetical protein